MMYELPANMIERGFEVLGFWGWLVKRSLQFTALLNLICN